MISVLPTRRHRPLRPWMCGVALCLASSCLPGLSSIQPAASAGDNRLVTPTPGDADGDGLLDATEDSLARAYSPVFYLAADEPNLPVPVQLILMHTELRWIDRRCGLDSLLKSSPSIDDLHQRVVGSCGDTSTFDSSVHRDRDRRVTFYLKTVAAEQRHGSPDRRSWVTYTHVYQNDRCLNGNCGTTIQYWLGFAFNSGTLFGWGVGPGDHGGDWESGHVVLGATGHPEWVRFLGHRSIDSLPWNDVEHDGNHPILYVARGSHTVRPRGDKTSAPFVSGLDGPLQNLGERTAPRRGSEFVRFAGLWGSPGRIDAGYWGPAFNETSEGKRNFITAWCLDAHTPFRRVEVSSSEFIDECFSPQSR